MTSDIKLVMTCSACPEQYDAFSERGEQVGYLRLRFGHFTVECPGVQGELVYSADLGDEWQGLFNDNERDVHLGAARDAIAAWMARR